MATVSLLYKSIVEMSIQAEVSHDIDSLMHTVQDILNSPTLCHRALRADAGSTYVGWNPGGPPGVVGTIQANDGTGALPPVVVVTANTALNVSSKVQVGAISIRDPNPARFEGQPATTQFMQAGITYTAATAKVELTFAWKPEYMNIGLPPGLLRPRYADVTVAVLGGQVLFVMVGQPRNRSMSPVVRRPVSPIVLRRRHHPLVR